MPPASRDSLAPGAPVRVYHNKPWKRSVTMTGTVTSWDGETLVLDRGFSAGGQYDSLFVPKLAGDWGTIEVVQGSWVLRRTYHRRDGTLIGELYNIQTPAEIAAGSVRYTDLEIDVVRLPDGRVSIVDEDDLDAAVRARGIAPDVAETARAIAYRLADILRSGGDWRSADIGPRGTPHADPAARKGTTSVTESIGGSMAGDLNRPDHPNPETNERQSPRGHGGEEGSARQSGGSQESGQGSPNKHPSKRGAAHGKQGGKGDNENGD